MLEVGLGLYVCELNSTIHLPNLPITLWSVFFLRDSRLIDFPFHPDFFLNTLFFVGIQNLKYSEIWLMPIDTPNIRHCNLVPLVISNHKKDLYESMDKKPAYTNSQVCEFYAHSNILEWGTSENCNDLNVDLLA